MAAPTAGKIGDSLCNVRIYSAVQALRTKPVLTCNNQGATLYCKVYGSRYYSVICGKQCLLVNPVTTPSHRFQYTHASGHAGRLRNRRLDLPRRSQEFISNLRKNERETLLAELLKYQKVNSDEASSTKHVEIESDTSLPETPSPTKQQLRLVAFSNALPFIGFGFFDNAIMIIAGDYIDMTIGGVLSISTMAAAGFGNMISDVAGIGLAGTVEALVSRTGVQIPVLTPEQQDLTKTRWTAGMARAIGIAFGCMIGMFPLLFLKTKEDCEDEEKGTT